MIYWSLPVVLLIFQAVFTVNSINQIREEELVESVRNVWWFQNHLVTSGAYSNLGWYAVLAVVYNIFGFSLHTAKFVKLAIVLASFFSLAAVLKKFLGVGRAWLPLLTIGLSPTLLYFGTLQVPMLLDVNLFLICLYLAVTIDFKSSYNPFKSALLWFVTMLGWLIYPAFLYFLPIIFTIYFFKLVNYFGHDTKAIVKNVLFSFFAFCAPLVVAALYIQNRGLLLYDGIWQRGLFRSNGGFELSTALFWDNLKTLLSDLFMRYNSYYFEIPKVEFSDYYPIAGVLFVLIASFFIALKSKKYRLLIAAAGTYLIICLILINLVGPYGLGGIRRAGVLLILFYALFVFVWKFAMEQKRVKPTVRYVFIGLCAIFLFHHLIVFPANLAHLRNLSPYRDQFWFARGETPEKSLAMFVNAVQVQDLSLACIEKDNKLISCLPVRGYSSVYGAIKGSCFWNRLQCHQLNAFDSKLDQVVPLDFNFWAGNNWGR